jgi:hypothetical protein
MGGGVLRLRTSTSNSCRIESRRGQGGAPGRGREVRREEGARGSPSLADFYRGCPQGLRSPAIDSVDSAAP